MESRKSKLKIHPELKAWLPDLEIEELQQLRQNLERDGCLSPIITWHGHVVDGHQRYDLCEELGIGYRTKELDFDTIDEVKLWMIKHQRGRRNWTEDQYAFAVAQGLKLKSGSAGRPIESDSESLGNTESENCGNSTITSVSEATGIDRSALSRAAKVNQKATGRVKRAVAAGDLPLSDAARIADLPKREQSSAIQANGKPAASPKDELGGEIPNELIEPFAARAAYDEALSHLTAISRLLNRLMGDARNNVPAGKGGKHLDRQRLRAAIAEARSVIGFARPYALCPKHEQGKCLVCGGIGWVVEHGYKTAGVK